MLASETFATGLKMILEALLRDQLKVLAKKVEWEDDKIPNNKPVLVKRIHEEMEKVGPKAFLEKFKTEDLEPLIETLDITPAPTAKKYVDSILNEADSRGVQNLFASFTPKKLQEFAEACGLSVHSTSMDTLIKCLLNQENHEPAKKKKAKPEKPSKKKPTIKKGITRVDLQSHYYRDELAEFCKDNGLRVQGNKKDFINRILAHVEGREQPPVKGTKGKRGRKRKVESDTEGEKKPAKKAKKTEKSEQSEKAESDKDSEEEKAKAKKKKPKKEDSESKSEDKPPKKAKAEKEKRKRMLNQARRRKSRPIDLCL